MAATMLAGFVYGDDALFAQGSISTVRRHGLIVVGLPGDTEHENRFAAAVKRLSQWMEVEVGIDAVDLTVLQADSLSDPARISNQKNLRSVIATYVETLTPDEGLWVLTLGHGSQDPRDGFFHLPGPDLNAEQWAGLFAGLKAKEQVFILTHSASGRFIKPFSLPGRVVVTATDDGEINEPRFAGAMIDVIDRQGAGPRVTDLLEFFLNVHRQVAGSYDEDHLLPTEHALLDDNGDGIGSESHALESVASEKTTPAEASLVIDGMLARKISFAARPATAQDATELSAETVIEAPSASLNLPNP